MNKNTWRNLLAKARRGDASAQYEVGRHYDDGYSNRINIKPQPFRALHWFTLSAKQGNKESQARLGNLLSSGDGGVKRDMEKAIFWYKQALKQGSSMAAHNIGTVYRDLGKPASAFRWYNRAVEMGDLDSLFEVALCHAFGFGTKQNLKTAYEALKKILDGFTSRDSCSVRTLENAHYWMGIFHLFGIGRVKKSFSEARDLLEFANEDQDHEKANDLLNLIGKTKHMMI